MSRKIKQNDNLFRDPTMDVPQHIAFTVGRLVVFVAAFRRKVVLLWAGWDGEFAGRKIVDLESIAVGSILIHGHGRYLCIFYQPKPQDNDCGHTGSNESIHADSASGTDQPQSSIESLSKYYSIEGTTLRGISVILMNVTLLACGNQTLDVSSETQLDCNESVTDIVAITSTPEDLLLLTSSRIIQCGIISLGCHQRLTVRRVYAHSLDSSLLNKKVEGSGNPSIRMTAHVDTDVDDIFVMIYGSFLYIQRLSESNHTLCYQSILDPQWQEAFKRYRRLSILKVIKLSNIKNRRPGITVPAHRYLIVGNPGIVVYMGWNSAGTIFISLAEAPSSMHLEYTGCVQCGSNLIFLNHRQQKLFCVKRVSLPSEDLHNVPAFVVIQTTLSEILVSESVIFRLDSIDFGNSDFPLSILLVHNCTGIVCHCIDPCVDAKFQGATPFTLGHKSFTLHSNELHGSVYELIDQSSSRLSRDNIVAMIFSRYHLFRRIEFYDPSISYKEIDCIIPAVLNYHKKDNTLVDKCIYLPPLPYKIARQKKNSKNHSTKYIDELVSRLTQSSEIYGDYLITVHTVTEAQKFAGLLIRRWMYYHMSSDFGPLLAACCYALITDLRTGSQNWCSLPFPFPHPNFKIVCVKIAESDFKGARVPELSILVCSSIGLPSFSLLGRCLFKCGIGSPVSYKLENLLLSITDLRELFKPQKTLSPYQMVYAGANSTYSFVSSHCKVLELYHDLSDGGASYDIFGCPLQQLRGYIYKQLCTALFHQLSGDYERTLAPKKVYKQTDEVENIAINNWRGYMTIGSNPNPRIQILNKTRGHRFYAFVAIVEIAMFNFVQPSFSIRRPVIEGTLTAQELEWLKSSQHIDQEVPLTLAFILLSQESGKAIKFYRLPVFAKLQEQIASSDQESSIYNCLDLITSQLNGHKSAVAIVNISVCNMMEKWVLVCVSNDHVWVYHALFGTLLILRQIENDLGPILAIQGLSQPRNGAIYLHGQQRSQLILFE